MVLTLVQIFAIVLVTIPLSLSATIVSQWRRTHALFFALARWWAISILRIARIRVTVRGAENIDPAASYILAANHASLFDIAAILEAVPGKICFVMKRELTRIPIWGWGLIRSPYIVINRTSLRDARRGMEYVAAQLREPGGRSVLFFPEGTRTRDGTLQLFKRGAFAAAVFSGAPVVPISINGSFALLPKGEFKIHRGVIEIVIGKPIASKNISEQELMRVVQQAIVASLR